MPADPISTFLIGLGIDPLAFVLALAAAGIATAILACLMLESEAE